MMRALPFLFAIVLTTPFWDLGHPLWEVDDARYAEVPREMHESGDWLTPSLNYVDYIEKPPMIYWLGALSYKSFGVSETASRFPLALLAVLGMLGVWWLGYWLYSPTVGLFAGIILGTCAEFSALSHLITPDMALSVSLLWATALILRCLRRPGDRWAGALAWVAMAAAFLSKGLISVVFPAAWALMLVFFFPVLRRGLKPLLLNWGLPVFIFVIGGWFYAMERANPGFFHVFIVEQHFQRFLDTQKYNRPGPWYYFIAVDIVGTLPWTPLLALAAVSPFWYWRRTDARDRQLALWFALIFIFFSVSSSKLITYILPLFAHQALLGARMLSRLKQDGRAQRRVSRLAGVLFAVFAAAALFAMLAAKTNLYEKFTPMELPSDLIITGVLLLAVLAYAMSTLYRGDEERIITRNAFLGLAVTGLLIIGTGYLNDQISVRRMGLELKGEIEALPPETNVRILAYNKYLHGIPFYTGRPVDVINWVGELHYAKRFARYRHRFGGDETVHALPDPSRRTFVTVQRRDLEHFLNVARRDKIRKQTPYGPWALIEF